MKKLWILLCVCVVLLLAACTPQLPQETSPQPQEYTVSAQQINSAVAALRNEDPHIATGELLKDGTVRVTSHSAGTATVRLVTPYGESFPLTVQCDEKLQITVTGGYVPPKAQVTVTDFGAVPDDGMDDTVAIQKAMDSLKEGGAVYFPKGVYTVGRLILRENVALRLEGVVPDPTLGYEVSGAFTMIQSRDFAVLQTKGKTDMFMNHEFRGNGRDGCSGFSISGGVLDMKGSRRCLVLSCAENVVLENTVFLDGPNDHVIQLGGCKNVTIRGCIFAGYHYKNNNSGAEAIQIEQTHPGAMGAASNSPSVFAEGEQYFCENIQILDCWFGASESYDSPTYAIGHHGQGHRSSVTGLVIRGCVFDNCRCSAIRYPAFSDVQILDNTFLNDRDNCVSPQDKPAQIELYLCRNNVYLMTENAEGEQVKAWFAKKDNCVGSINTVIQGNRFQIGSNYTAVKAAAHGIGYDVSYETGDWMLSRYDQTPVFYTGPVAARNVIEMLTVRDNCVEVYPGCESDGYFYHFTYVRGLAIENNRVEGAVYENSSSKMDGVVYPNCRIIGCTTQKSCQETLMVQVPKKELPGDCLLVVGEETYALASGGIGTVAVTVQAKGGRVDYTIDDDGVLVITVTPDEGVSVQGVTMPSYAEKDADGVYLLPYSGTVDILCQ